MTARVSATRHGSLKCLQTVRPSVADGLLQNLKNAKIRMGQGAIDAAGALQSLEMLMTLEHAAAAKHSVRAK